MKGTNAGDTMSKKYQPEHGKVYSQSKRMTQCLIKKWDRTVSYSMWRYLSESIQKLPLTVLCQRRSNWVSRSQKPVISQCVEIRDSRWITLSVPVTRIVNLSRFPGYLTVANADLPTRWHRTRLSEPYVTDSQFVRTTWGFSYYTA